VIEIRTLEELALSEYASRFEHADHGGGVSFFVSRHPPGTGPRLHRHPYDETFLVQRGSATFTVDGETAEVAAGGIVVVPAGAAHAFVASGDEDLHQISMNPSGRMIQEWVAEG
jgi:quercetin dioxygenase-like cupin family protein